MNIIKVASNSRVSAVAGAIAHAVRENGGAQAQGIGAGAVNQMVKATITAKRFLAEEGSMLTFTPEYVDVDIQGEERTAVRLIITATNGDAPVSRPAAGMMAVGAAD
ncbi:MAG: stage V sporulation protein S [Chloroflexota bacterium]|jgi:stage V sporulation protein S